MTTPAYLAVEIGGTKLQLIAYNGNAQCLQRWRFQVAPGKGAEGIRSQIAQVLPEILAGYRLLGAGVGFGGPVNRREGRVMVSHQIGGWSGFPLAAWLEELGAGPVWIDNDANVAALGEARYGAGQGQRTVFYITTGSGIGGGLVQEGRLYHGRFPGEAEIGHIRLDREGTTLEAACAGWAVDQQIRAAIALHPQSVLAGICAQHAAGGEARWLRPALEQGCELAAAILKNTATTLAWGLSHAVHLFHPDIIILGGGLSLLGPAWQQAVATALPAFVMDAFQPPPPVQLAALGEDAVPLGALALVLQHVKEQ